jgi:hypothetical protein
MLTSLEVRMRAGKVKAKTKTKVVTRQYLASLNVPVVVERPWPQSAPTMECLQCRGRSTGWSLALCSRCQGRGIVYVDLAAFAEYDVNWDLKRAMYAWAYGIEEAKKHSSAEQEYKRYWDRKASY